MNFRWKSCLFLKIATHQAGLLTETIDPKIMVTNYHNIMREILSLNTHFTNRALVSKLSTLAVCSVASTFYLYEYLVRVMPSAMTRGLMLSFDIQATGLGLLAALFFYGYAPMQIPAGILYDRFGPRKLLASSLCICGLATFLFGATSSYYIALFARLLSGTMASFAFVGALYVGSNWIQPRNFAIYTGLVQALGCVGAILGQGPVASLNSLLGWHKTSMMIAFIGLLLALLNWLVIRDQPPASLNAIKHPDATFEFKNVFKNSQNWWIALYAFFIWGPIVSFTVLWSVPYLQDTYHLDKIYAASITSITWVGIAIGGPIMGLWSTRIGLRRLPGIVCAFIGLLASLCILYINNLPITVISILFFLIGIASSSQSIVFGLTRDINRKQNLGTAIGFINMAVIGGGLILQPLIGLILDSLWTGKTVKTIAIYDVHTFRIALSIIPISYLLAMLLIVFLICETHCQTRYE